MEVSTEPIPPAPAPPAAELGEPKFQYLLLAFGLFLVLYLWSLASVLGPLVLFLALVYLLAPLSGTPVYGRLITVLGFLTLLWLIRSAGGILTPFVLALVLAYILNPLVNRAERRGVGRGLGALLVMGLFLLVFVLAVIALGPLLVSQLGNFVSRLPEFLEGAVQWVQRTIERVSHVPLPGVRRLELGDVLNLDADRVDEFVTSRGTAIRGVLLTGVAGVGKGLGMVLTVVSYLLITPILTYYVLRDFDGIVRGAARLVPVHRRERTFALVREFDVLLGKFLRSQLLVSLLVGLIIGVGFWLVGFPYALLLAVLAGVFNVVPYLGLILSLIPALLIALVSGDVLVDLLKIALVYGVEQVLENYFSPRIVGQSVGLHPVWVMLAIVLFSFFFGVIGLLIAVPLAVGIKLLVSDLVRTYRASNEYRGAGPTRAGTSAAAGEAA